MADADLDRLVRDYAAAKATLADLRPLLYAEIYEYGQRYAQDRGWQARLVKVTGLTREGVRQIIASETDRRAREETQ